MPDYEVSVSCKDLADKDVFSKSDPVLIFLENVPNSKRFVELGKTELIKDCLNPQFVKKFRLSSKPNQDPKLRVAVVDIDNFEDLENVADQEFIGRADFHLSDLVSSPVFTASLGGREAGLVTLKTSLYDASLDGLVTMEMEASAGFEAAKGNPLFLEIHRADHSVSVADAGRVCSAAYSLAHRTEQSQTGCFQPISASLFTICRGDVQRLLRIECWRRGPNGGHKLLASRHTCLAELQSLKTLEFPDGNKSGRVRGLVVKQIDVQRSSAVRFTQQ